MVRSEVEGICAVFKEDNESVLPSIVPLALTGPTLFIEGLVLVTILVLLTNTSPLDVVA